MRQVGALLMVGLAILVAPALAGEKGKMVALLADYDDIKERAVKIRQNRADGYSSEPGMIVAVQKDCGELIGGAEDLNTKLLKVDLENGQQPSRERKTVMALRHACTAITGMMSAEFDYTYAKEKKLLDLGAKFNEVFRLADEMIQANRKPAAP